jgi:Zn-dependent membrane protease YugP
MMFDPLYLAIIIGSMGLSFFASMYVKSKFKDGQKIGLRSYKTGYEVAQAILADAGIDDVKVVEYPGFMSDHYNPMSKTLALSPDVYHGRTAASAGVAAHEVGHALQHAENYLPMWARSVIVPAANIGSNLGPWIIIAGMMLGVASGMGYALAVTGVILFGAATVFTVITVPVEFDASARAKDRLRRMGIVNEGQEAAAVSGVLTAAGLTYVAAAMSSIAMLLYWAMRAGLFGRQND